ncbi:MAG: hypothetical protein ABSB52_01360 [Acidimicrobiales bacterium]
MPEERPAYETLLDAFVYAPLGAALVLADELPRLAQRGREGVEKRVAVARLVGRFTVEGARRRLETLSGDPFGSLSRRPEAVSPEPGPAGGDTAPAVRTRRASASSEVVSPRGGPPAPGNHDEHTAAHPQPETTPRELAIPAYDTLAASQVVERLASLTPAELEAVRRHESATRRRRTVLHRIAQLSSERDNATA